VTLRIRIATPAIALVAVVSLAACGGAKAPATPSTQPTAAPEGRAGAGEGSEIERLDAAIADQLGQLGLAAPSDAEVLQASIGGDLQPLASADARSSCDGEPAGAGCDDVCTLADSICRNADRICDLADQLGDTWASQRCTAGRLSCERAVERCCAC
jgi:hypothetical protein